MLADEVKPEDDEAAVAPPAMAQRPRFQRYMLGKRSGVQGVLWHRRNCAWEVQIPKYDAKDKRKGKKPNVFSQKGHGGWP